MGEPMAFEEKRAWIMLIVSALAYLIYVALIVTRAHAAGAALSSVSYAATLLWTIGGAIATSIAANIVIAFASPEDANKADARDREIGRFGEYIGQSFVVIGGISALILSLLKVDHFWIANAIYLAFVLSALLGSCAKLAAYRQGLPPC